MFWKWDEAVSTEMCDMLLEERKSLTEFEGLTGDSAKSSRRNSRVCWAKTNHWVEAILYNHALYANESAGWNFSMGRPEVVQLTSYKEGEFYNWHEDWDAFAQEPTVRKLSAVLLLSDPEEFEGGQFEFDDADPVTLKKGSILVFPSFVRHRVTKVTGGVRYSAVCWVRGPRIF